MVQGRGLLSLGKKAPMTAFSSLGIQDDCEILADVRSHLWPALLPIMLLLSACTPAVGPVGVPGPAIVDVVDRGWHTDIGLPADEITGPLANVARDFPSTRFLTFGFGQREFFMAQHETTGGALRALLPSRSVLLVTTLRTAPAEAFGAQHVVTLHVSQAGAARIEAAIWQQMQKGPDGAPVSLGAGPDPGSVFYAARGTYDAFDTCNTWTVELLRAGGLPVSSGGVVFSGQVMGMARNLAAQQEVVLRGGSGRNAPCHVHPPRCR